MRNLKWLIFFSYFFLFIIIVNLHKANFSKNLGGLQSPQSPLRFLRVCTYIHHCINIHIPANPHAFGDHLTQLKDGHGSHAFFKYSLTPQVSSKKSYTFYFKHPSLVQRMPKNCFKVLVSASRVIHLLGERFRIMRPVTPKLSQFGA